MKQVQKRAALKPVKPLLKMIVCALTGATLLLPIGTHNAAQAQTPPVWRFRVFNDEQDTPEPAPNVLIYGNASGSAVAVAVGGTIATSTYLSGTVSAAGMLNVSGVNSDNASVTAFADVGAMITWMGSEAPTAGYSITFLNSEVGSAAAIVEDASLTASASIAYGPGFPLHGNIGAGVPVSADYWYGSAYTCIGSCILDGHWNGDDFVVDSGESHQEAEVVALTGSILNAEDVFRSEADAGRAYARRFNYYVTAAGAARYYPYAGATAGAIGADAMTTITVVGGGGAAAGSISHQDTSIE